MVRELGIPQGQVSAFMNTVMTPKKMWRFWRRVGSASEFGNRVAIYNRLVQQRQQRVDELVRSGMSAEDALQQAVEVEGLASDAEAAFQGQDLLNFTRSGDYAAMQMMIQIIPFLNARVQGLNRLYRGAKDNPTHFLQRGGTLLAAAITLALINDDDDRYRNLPEWDKDTYIHFWIGDEHFRIPKPFETGAIFMTIPERIVAMLRGQDGFKEFRQSMLHGITETFAFNPVPQLAKPILESYMNRSFFTDAPVVTLNEQDLIPEAQYDFRTSEFAKQVAEAMPDVAPEWARSPKRIEHLVRGYFGAMGMYAVGAANVLTESAVYGTSRTLGDLQSQRLHELPVIKRFYQAKVPTTTKYNRLLWDMLSEADGLARTMKKYIEEGRFEDALGIQREYDLQLAVRPRLRQIATEVSKINRLLNQNEVNFSIPPEQRRRNSDRLLEQRNKLTQQIAPYIDLF